jgi:hypothetical protein
MVEFGVSAYEILHHILLSSIPKDPAGPTPFFAFGVLVGSAIGFLAPGLAVWYLLKEVPAWQFSLRTMTILIILMTILLGVIVLLYHSGIWA